MVCLPDQPGWLIKATSLKPRAFELHHPVYLQFIFKEFRKKHDFAKVWSGGGR
jgi:hypothetical protein